MLILFKISGNTQPELSCAPFLPRGPQAGVSPGPQHRAAGSGAWVGPAELAGAPGAVAALAPETTPNPWRRVPSPPPVHTTRGGGSEGGPGLSTTLKKALGLDGWCQVGKRSHCFALYASEGSQPAPTRERWPMATAWHLAPSPPRGASGSR